MNPVQSVNVGSVNPVKIAAVRTVVARVFPEAEVTGQSTTSGVSDQPWGDAETRQGALNRARAALDAAGSDLGVGLEGGVFEMEAGLMTHDYVSCLVSISGVC